MAIIENLRFCGVSFRSNRMLVYTNQRDHIGSRREGKNRQTCYSIIILCIRDLIFFVVVHNKYNTLSPQFHWMLASERFFIAIISRKTHGIVYCTQVMTFTEEHFDFKGEMIQKASYLNQTKYFSISYSTYMSKNASLELPRLPFLNAILTQKSSQLLFWMCFFLLRLTSKLNRCLFSDNKRRYDGSLIILLDECLYWERFTWIKHFSQLYTLISIWNFDVNHLNGISSLFLWYSTSSQNYIISYDHSHWMYFSLK